MRTQNKWHLKNNKKNLIYLPVFFLLCISSGYLSQVLPSFTNVITEKFSSKTEESKKAFRDIKSTGNFVKSFTTSNWFLETNLIKNGDFSLNTDNWILGTGWVYDTAFKMIKIESVDNNSILSQDNIPDLGTIAGNNVLLKLSLGAKDQSNSSGNSGVLEIRIGDFLCATINNNNNRNTTNNVTITNGLGVTSDFVNFSTNAVEGYVMKNFTLTIPKSRIPVNSKILKIIKVSGLDDWAVKEVKIPLLLDTDGDGVLDGVDLDDDNDGIIDVLENSTCGVPSPDIAPGNGVIIHQLFKEDFGEMSLTKNTKSVSLENLGSNAKTTYTYHTAELGTTPTNSNAPNSLQDGRYTVFNNIQNTSSWAAGLWQTIGDHTNGGVSYSKGRMFIVNASATAGEFYRKTLDNVIQGAPINASLWAMNLDISTANSGRILPNIRVNFVQNNKIVYHFFTGNLPRFPVGDTKAWQFFKNPSVFIPTSSAPIDVVLVNEVKGGEGNDLAIDDIIVYQTLCDYDNDGIPNYLDLDSDGDGFPDALEGSGQFTKTDLATASGNLKTQSPNLNFGNSVSSTGIPIIIGASGQGVGQSLFPDEDSDGDGVSNSQDLDSDNDGVLNSNECYGDLITNGSFTGNSNGWTLGNWTYVNNEVYNVQQPTSGQILSQNIGASAISNQLYKLSFKLGSTDYDNSSQTNTASLQVRLGGVTYATFNNAVGRDNNVTLALSNGAASNFMPYSSTSSRINTENVEIYIPLNKSLTTNTNLEFVFTSDGDDFYLDDIKMLGGCDTDGDGIPNYLDLDSDGDGCPDAIEGTGGFKTNDLMSATGTIATQTTNQNLGVEVDANGVPTRVGASGQGVGNSQNILYNNCLDSDGDGVPDNLDLDNDNDGILDVNEICKSPVTKGFHISYSSTVLEVGNTTVVPTTATISPEINEYSIGWHYGYATEAVGKEFIINFDRPVYLTQNGLDFSLSDMDYRSTFGNFFIVYEDGTRMSNLDFNIQNLSTSGAIIKTTIAGSSATQTQNFINPSADIGFIGLDRSKRIRSMGYTVHALNGENNTSENMIPLVQLDCDMDGDGIPNHLDLDSDGDGCPDAFEGAGNFARNSLVSASGSLTTQTPNQNFGTTVDANGIPTIVGASGQGVGNSQIETRNDCIEFVCPPDAYSTQQTWWLPYRWHDEYKGTAVMIDFQTGEPVVNIPEIGKFGHTDISSFEGNVSVTHPKTGKLLFVTDGKHVYRGEDGVKAQGSNIRGNDSSGESASVIPDPEGILGKDFIIFGNSASSTSDSLFMAKYNVETNVVSDSAAVLSNINEALEVIPHSNGEDYWILVNTSDQFVKSYLYSKSNENGYGLTLVSQTEVLNFAGVDPGTIATNSFISWDPTTPDRLLIARHNKIGLANFDPSTGVLGKWDVKITMSTNNVEDDQRLGYSAALSPNGRYIYYISESNKVAYYDLTNGETKAIGMVGLSGFGLKIGPDKKLYIVGFLGSDTSLFYFNNPDDPNINPVHDPTTNLPMLDTKGLGVSLQLPNNVYWGCITCKSGTADPILTNSTIVTPPATVGDLITLLSSSNKPSGAVFTIHSSATATDTNQLSNSAAFVAGTTYYISFYDGLANCYSPTTVIKIGEAFCYKPAVTDGNTYPTQHGITSLGRAGDKTSNWPMVRQSAWTVLESKSTGLVVNRVRFDNANNPVDADGVTRVITSPVEGMVVYDTTNKCLKVYTAKEDGDALAWHCMITQACPD